MLRTNARLLLLLLILLLIVAPVQAVRVPI